MLKAIQCLFLRTISTECWVVSTFQIVAFLEIKENATDDPRGRNTFSLDCIPVTNCHKEFLTSGVEDQRNVQFFTPWSTSFYKTAKIFKNFTLYAQYTSVQYTTQSRSPSADLAEVISVEQIVPEMTESEYFGNLTSGSN